MVLVTGGTGFIGSHLLDKLAASGAPVRALVRRKMVLPEGVEAVFGDLANGQGIENAVRGASVVFHVAGVTKAIRTADYYVGNTRATENLARALAGRGARLIHVSSVAAAGPSRDGAPVTEEADPRPVTDYGKSKLEAESIVRSLVADAVIIRPPVVYGPRDTAVLQILKPICRGVSLEISGGEPRFSLVYVRDLVDGLLAARAQQAAGRIYFLAYPKPISWSELVCAAAGIVGRAPRVLRVPVSLAYAIGFWAEIWSSLARRPGIISRAKVRDAGLSWVCDTRRAAAELGFEAKTPLEVGLAETMAWYKEAGWLKY